MQLSQDTLLGILAAVLIADVLVVLLALLWTQVQKRRQRSGYGSGYGNAGYGSSSYGPPPGSERIGSGGSSGPSAGYGAGSGYASRPVMGSSPAASSPLGGLTGGSPAAASAPESRPFVAPAPSDPAVDGLTGLLVPAAWARTLADEEARIRRYHRPATVVLIEIEGLERLMTRLGPASIERIVPAVADTLRRDAREADHVARLGTGRFGVLMPETDEVLAINYIERVRRACDLWLESGAVSLRLAIGWASSTGDGSLIDAEAQATDRMYNELRRAARNNAPPSGPTSTAGGEFDQEPAFGS